MIEARLRCDGCGVVLDAHANSQKIRGVAQSKGWTNSGGKDFCPACSDSRAKATTELPDIPGTPIPGFPGYRLDRKPDGSWGIRSAKAWRGRPPGSFLKPTEKGSIMIPDADGKYAVRRPDTWADYVFSGVEPVRALRKLSDEQARSVFHRYHDLRETAPQISAALGVSVPAVQNILRGVTYRDVTADLQARYPATRPSPIPRANAGPLPTIPGVPIPGFPGYTLDKTEDGSWGIRTARSGKPGRFMRGSRSGLFDQWFALNSPDGGKVGRSLKGWTEYVLSGDTVASC